MRRLLVTALTTIGCLCLVTSAQATAIGFSNTSGAYDYVLTDTPPNPVVQDPNDGILLMWDEVQNHTLAQDLRVDRVADPNAPFIQPDGSAYKILSGTIVSSHYVQWDPGNGSLNTVGATLIFDSEIFAFITADQKLLESDPILGLPDLDYNNFGSRGLEGADTTAFQGSEVVISWTATSPGDWTRLITAYSPGGVVPAPPSLLLLGSGLLGILAFCRKSVKHRSDRVHK